MWHHTWVTCIDPLLHCSTSWCHLCSQLFSNNRVCIARWWAITISSRGGGNIAASLRPALGFSSYHHMTVRSILRTKTVFIFVFLRRRRLNDLHLFFVQVQSWQLQVMLLCLHTRIAMSLFSEKQLLQWGSHLNSSLVSILSLFILFTINSYHCVMCWHFVILYTFSCLFSSFL